jgi:hypothetical protein
VSCFIDLRGPVVSPLFQVFSFLSLDSPTFIHYLSPVVTTTWNS